MELLIEPTYSEILEKFVYLDCSDRKDLRGKYIHNKVVKNAQRTQLDGSVFYGCYVDINTNYIYLFDNTIQVDAKGSIRDVKFQLQRINCRVGDFENSEFVGADFSFSTLYKCNLKNADLFQAQFFQATLKHSDFENANLQFAHLAQTVAVNANFKYANVQGVNFNYSNLQHADFDNADIRGTNFLNAFVHNVTFINAVYNKETVFDSRGYMEAHKPFMKFIEDED